MPEDMPDRVPEDMPEQIAEDMPARMPEDMPDRMPEDMQDKMPEGMSDRMPEDLPVTECINVMVGITRSKVIGPYSVTLLKPGNFRHPPCAGYVPFCTSVLRNRLLCSRSSTSTCQHETKACQMVQEGVPVSTRLFVRLVV